MSHRPIVVKLRLERSDHPRLDQKELHAGPSASSVGTGVGGLRVACSLDQAVGLEGAGGLSGMFA